MPLIDSIVIFVVTGVVSMSGALCAGAINKLTEDDRPAFAKTRSGMMQIVLAGNLCAITLIFSAAYGFNKLEWWIALSCMFITFPLFYYVLLQKLVSNLIGLLVMTLLSIASLPVLYLYW